MIIYGLICCFVCITKTLKIRKKVRELVTYGERGSGPDRGQGQRQEFSKYAFYIVLIFEPFECSTVSKINFKIWEIR